jgi:hypothetical protein
MPASSWERIAVSSVRERGPGAVESIPLVEVIVHPERGVQTDEGGCDDERDEEVEPRAREREDEHRGGREHGQHDAVVDLAAEAQERLPVRAAEVEAQPRDEEREEGEHGDRAVDEADEDEDQRDERVVGAEVGDVPPRPRPGLPAAVRAREGGGVQHLPPRARPPRRGPRDRPRAGEEGDSGLRRRRRRRRRCRPVRHRHNLPLRLQRRRRGGDGAVARPGGGGGGHGGRGNPRPAVARDRAVGGSRSCGCVGLASIDSGREADS